jgi:acylphosphatase
MKAYAVTVRGLVQGVFFRASTKKKADSLGLSGFVRNEEDGSVYIEVQGEERALADFLEWCRHGPPQANVEDCQVDDIPVRNLKDFEVRRY